VTGRGRRARPVTGAAAWDRARSQEQLAAEIAAIDAAARAKAGDLRVPAGLKRGARQAARAEADTARAAVWAERSAQIQAATAAHLDRLRTAKAVRTAQAKAAHEKAAAAHRARVRSDQAMCRAESVRTQEQAMVRRFESHNENEEGAA
jgi:hypothetical protein